MIFALTTGRIDYRGKNAVDITVKSSRDAGKCLAPTWDLVGGHKAFKGDSRFVGKYPPLSDDAYAELYQELIRARFRENPKPFYDLILMKDVTLLCYCETGCFCHRYIAADILMKIAGSEKFARVNELSEPLEVIYAGEAKTIKLEKVRV